MVSQSETHTYSMNVSITQKHMLQLSFINDFKCFLGSIYSASVVLECQNLLLVHGDDPELRPKIKSLISPGPAPPRLTYKGPVATENMETQQH